MRATLSVGVLFGLIAAAAAAPVPKDDAPPPVTERHLKASLQNLKQLGLAFHSYHDITRVLPTNITDRNGKPLLSWRVAILPYLEEDRLYKQFKLEEPWDSEHNKKLIEKMPTVYAPIRVKAKAGETFYQVFYGKGALFRPAALPIIPGSVPDGTSKTAMVAEAAEPVIWTRPADIPFDHEKKDLPKLGGMFDGDFNVTLCDGSVIRVKKNANPAHLKHLIMPADGYVIDMEQLTNPRS